MRFSSFVFLFWFLPLVLLLYFGLPALLRGGWRRWRLPLQNGILLVASLFFYGWGEPVYVLLMPAVILLDFGLGVAIGRGRHARFFLWSGVALHLALLFYFKYAGAFLALFGLHITLPTMPIGISFYTFQGISYLADVYLGRIRYEKNPFCFGVYIALFPQLIAGPIVKYEEIAVALRERSPGGADAACGARRFVAGLAKKVLIADVAGALFTAFVARSPAEMTAAGALCALFGFFFQIYFDFSGYSDMAIGLGQIFGFPFPENFNYPYAALGFTDFWRRWHITLSSFFRTYVYIPLGGNRKGAFRTVLNLLAVWSLTGLWHGAGLNFLLWGLYYFLLLVAEKQSPRWLKAAVPRPVCRAITILGILFGWLLFAFDGSSEALALSALPRFLYALSGQNGLARGADLYDLVRHLPFFAIAALGATPLPRRLYTRVARRHPLLSALLPAGALLLSVAYLADASFVPFLYFRF